MSATVTVFPRRVIDEQASQLSKWNAVWNNIIYKIQRKDFLVESVDSNDGNARLNSGGGGFSVTAGEVIYVSVGAYTGLYEVLQSTSNTVTIDTPYTITATNGFFNYTEQRLNYYLQVKIMRRTGTSTYTLQATDKRVPDTTGLSTVDVASYLRSLVSMDNTSDYSEVVIKDGELGGVMNIQIKEVWFDSDNAFSAINPSNDIYFINAAKQALELYGSNVGGWMMFVPDEDYEYQKGIFLTEFARPTYFPGYPFDLSFIYPEVISDADLALEAIEKRYDGNGGLVSTVRSFVPEGNKQGVNRLKLQGGYASTIRTVNAYLNAATAYVGHGYMFEDYVEVTELEVSEQSPVTEVKTIDIEHSCLASPVYLCWHNRYGGKSYWMFHTVQEEGHNTKIDSMGARYVEDIEEQHTKNDIVALSANEYKVVGVEGLSHEKALGLLGLRFSHRVQMLVSWDGESAPVWRTVIIRPGTFKLRDTDDTLHSLRFSFDLPEMNLPQQ